MPDITSVPGTDEPPCGERGQSSTEQAAALAKAPTVEQFKDAFTAMAASDQLLAKWMIEAGTRALEAHIKAARRDFSVVDQGMLGLLALVDTKRLTPKLKEVLSQRVSSALRLGGSSNIENAARKRFGVEAGQ